VRDGRVLLVCHVNPDGDALGSMLGFALGLRRLGVSDLRATFPGVFEVPEPFVALPGLDLLVPEEQAYPDPDLVIFFDVAAESRLGALVDRLSAKATVVLDHHASNTRFGGVNLVDAHAAATSVVAEELLARLDVPLDKEIAECLYVALATDTGSFKFDMTTPRVHEMAARLIATGIRPGDISRRIFDTRPFGAMKLFGEVLGRAALDPSAAGGHGMVWTWATLDDLERYRQRPYVLDALIDPVRTVAEADVSVVVKQTGADEWAVSLRSKGAVDVSRVAVALGGGGHRLAAGFTGHGAPGEVVAAVREQLDRFLI
jgi:phosphoesterase RecJ-like protein